MKTRLLALAFLGLIQAFTNAAEPEHDFIVHEWGTFTSVQGADGAQMIWNPLVAPDLPHFVYDQAHRQCRVKNIVVAGKTGTATRQRMETPVMYFYSDRARTVDVAVRFPEGRVTEWYPQETALELSGLAEFNAPSLLFLSDQVTARYPQESFQLNGVTKCIAPAPSLPVLHWKNIEVLPRHAGGMLLPTDQTASHYYAARETDASELQVLAAGDSGTKEFEKFLFYRGVASTAAPLTVKLDSSNSRQIILTNTGADELAQLFVYEIRAGGGAWLDVKYLRPGETRTVSFEAATGARAITAADLSLDDAMKVSSPRLNTSLLGALTTAGLYPKEAAAMIRTWEDSWFGEPGLRVLYTLPRSWTDRTLPVTITPTPKTIERVMIARAELITPSMEQALLEQVQHYLATKPEERPKIVAETRKLGLGRFTGPTLQRLLQYGKLNSEFSTKSWELVQAAMAANPTTDNGIAAGAAQH
jgi:hypothetical protein